LDLVVCEKLQSRKLAIKATLTAGTILEVEFYSNDPSRFTVGPKNPAISPSTQFLKFSDAIIK
jgi:hypothetical protein